MCQIDTTTRAFLSAVVPLKSSGSNVAPEGALCIFLSKLWTASFWPFQLLVPHNCIMCCVCRSVTPTQRASSLSMYRWLSCYHAAVTWWRHQMTTFSAWETLCVGNSSRSLWRHCKDNFEIFLAFLALCQGNPPMASDFPSRSVSNAELKYFLWCHSEETVERTVELWEI